MLQLLLASLVLSCKLTWGVAERGAAPKHDVAIDPPTTSGGAHNKCFNADVIGVIIAGRCVAFLPCEFRNISECFVLLKILQAPLHKNTPMAKIVLSPLFHSASA